MCVTSVLEPGKGCWAGKLSAVSGSEKVFDKGCDVRERGTSCDFYFDPLVLRTGRGEDLHKSWNSQSFFMVDCVICGSA